jgi:hypothetical protein
LHHRKIRKRRKKHPVRLNLSARISQPFSSIFLSEQISTSRSAMLLHPAEQGERKRKLLQLTRSRAGAWQHGPPASERSI